MEQDLPSKADIELFSKPPWIERLWTFQELLLSSNPVILCGSKAVTWDSMISSILPHARSRPANPSSAPPGPITSWKRKQSDFNNARWRELANTWLVCDRPIYWRGRKMRIQSYWGLWYAREISEENANSTTSFAAHRRTSAGHCPRCRA